MKEQHSILTHGPLILPLLPPLSLSHRLDTHTLTYCYTVSEPLLYVPFCHEILPRSGKPGVPVDVCLSVCVCVCVCVCVMGYGPELAEQ